MSLLRRSYVSAADALVSDVESVLFDQSPTLNAERIEIDITGGVSANIADSDATVEFWCRPTSANSEDDTEVFNGNIIVDGDNFAGNGGSFIISINGGVINIGVNPESSGTGQPSGYVDFRGTTVIDDDAWHHIAMTWDQSSGALQGYVDGSREINQTVNTQGTGNIHWLSGGGAQDQLLVLAREKGSFNTNACYYGRLSELRISPSILYSGASFTVPTAALDGSGAGVAYYAFDEGTGTTVADTGGGTNSNGTIVGGAWDLDGPYS